MTAEPSSAPSRRSWRAVVLLLVTAPVFGEVLSTATAPLDALLPWNLALMVGAYGCSAVLCREIAHRYRLGWPGLFLLGAAFGVFLEGLVDRFWYDPEFWSETGVETYSVVWDVNVLLATHLTVFHTAMSVVASIVVVERLTPDSRHRSWLRLPGLCVCVVAMACVFVVYWETFYRPPNSRLVAAVALMAVLVVAALLLPPPTPKMPKAQSQRRLGWIAFSATATHFITVYAIPTTGIPWPPGTAVSLAPVVIGAIVIHRRATGGLDGHDALRVVAGIIAFFLMLNALFGLTGRLDMTLAAAVLAVALRRLVRSQAPNTGFELNPGLPL